MRTRHDAVQKLESGGWEEMVMRLGKLVAVAGLAAWLAGCGGGGTSVTVTLSPTATTVVLSGNQQFTATVNGSSNQNVIWSVNKIKGGDSTVGTISTTGLYTAPNVLPNPVTVTVTATSVANASASANATVTLDSGVRVTVNPLSATIGTSETLSLAATVTGTNDLNVTWKVDGVSGGNTTVGQICTSNSGPCTAPSGATSAPVFYLAPSTVPNPGVVTVTAASEADTSHFGNCSVTVVAVITPTLTALDPPTASQGSVFQDIYLTGTNFFTTSTVVAGTTPITTTFLSTTLLRARVPDSLLAIAGSLSVKVQSQSGASSLPQTLTVVPVRPTIVSSTPASAPQNGASFNVILNGGYFGTPTFPTVTAEFDGQPRLASSLNTRQLNVTVQGNPDLLNAGLFPLVLRNTSVAAGKPAIAASNLAVEPPASAISAAPTATFQVGSQPAAIAVNTATGDAVVANRGSNTLSVIDLNTSTVTTVPVGTSPTGVAVDNLLNIAAVVNNGSNTLSVVSLGGTPAVIGTLTLPSATTALSIGLNPLTGRALIANTSTNAATVVDLSTPSAPVVIGTVNIGTGLNPAVAIEARLNWAIVTPGGAGTISIVNLGRPSGPGDVGVAPFVVATASSSTSIQGIAINSQTEQALLTDPLSTFVTSFSVLDQAINAFTVGNGDKSQVAAAINPLTNIGVIVNSVSNQATVIDLRTHVALATIPVGTGPQAVAIDPVTNQALVVNTGSVPGTVSALSLGSLRPLHLTEISPIATAARTSPCASAPPLNLQLIGSGFVSGSVVRLDEVALPLSNVTFVSARHLTASVPACLLTSPRLYSLDVQNPDSTVTNVMRLGVIGAVTVGTSPQGVAIDPERELAVVTNAGDGTVSIVDLNALTASVPISVGSSPQGVAVLPRLHLAVVANSGSNTASIVDEVARQVASTVTVGSGPLGVAIHPDTARAVVANSGSNSVSTFSLTSPASVGAIAVDQRPEAVAIDPVDNLAAVTNTTQNTLVFIDLQTNSLKGRVSNLNIPRGVSFDPVTDVFLVVNSVQNNLEIIDPNTLIQTPILVGINPAGIDYNFQTGTIVTANFVSHTLSLLDFQKQQVTAVLGVENSSQFGVAIDPGSNIAVVVDTNNNRVLLVPLPR